MNLYTTRRVALIGMPLKRRHSQIMHDAAFAAAGLRCRYELFEIESGELPGFVERARQSEWYGFQITAPYKRVIMELLDHVEPAALAIGAVNSVLRQADGTLVGFNTDAPGFAAAAAEELGLRFAGASVVIAGAGGAARAVTRAVLDAGASTVLVAARRIDAAAEVVHAVHAAEDGHTARLSCCLFTDSVLTEALGEADLVVNTTTVGMLDSGTVVDPALFGAGTAVFDLVYVPSRTELIVGAQARGLHATNGMGMLVAQAEIAFERWTGVPSMGPVMRRALESLNLGDEAP